MGVRQSSWTDDQLAELKSMIDAGKTIPEIARTLDRTQEATRGKAARESWYAYPSRLFKGRRPTPR
ncbi:MAG: hypothetical protein NVS3B5_08440 [Sphingomicrobium sp.]